MLEAFIERGEKDAIVSNLEFYNRPDWEMHQFIIGMSYGTVLMPFTGINSLGVHLVSQTGFGKNNNL